MYHKETIRTLWTKLFFKKNEKPLSRKSMIRMNENNFKIRINIFTQKRYLKPTLLHKCKTLSPVSLQNFTFAMLKICQSNSLIAALVKSFFYLVSNHRNLVINKLC